MLLASQLKKVVRVIIFKFNVMSLSIKQQYLITFITKHF